MDGRTEFLDEADGRNKTGERDLCATTRDAAWHGLAQMLNVDRWVYRNNVRTDYDEWHRQHECIDIHGEASVDAASDRDPIS